MYVETFHLGMWIIYYSIKNGCLLVLVCGYRWCGVVCGCKCEWFSSVMVAYWLPCWCQNPGLCVYCSAQRGLLWNESTLESSPCSTLTRVSLITKTVQYLTLISFLCFLYVLHKDPVRTKLFLISFAKIFFKFYLTFFILINNHG